MSYQNDESFSNKINQNIDENLLLEKINIGDLDSFYYLYKEYYAALCVYAKNFTKDKEEAEDVVQDIFINLWEQRGEIKIKTSIKSYLFVSVRNASLNHIKHLQVVNKFNEFYTQKLKDAQELYFMTQETGDSILIARQLEEQLLAEIELLPKECREIFLMSRVDCLKHKEIAEKLGITINTVHRQTSIALEKLRKVAKKYLPALFFTFFNLLIR